MSMSISENCGRTRKYKTDAKRPNNTKLGTYRKPKKPTRAEEETPCSHSVQNLRQSNRYNGLGLVDALRIKLGTQLRGTRGAQNQS